MGTVDQQELVERASQGDHEAFGPWGDVLADRAPHVGIGPDDSYILGTPDGGSAALPQLMLDPVAGTSKTMPWTRGSLPSTQRDAP